MFVSRPGKSRRLGLDETAPGIILEERAGMG